MVGVKGRRICVQGEDMGIRSEREEGNVRRAESRECVGSEGNVGSVGGRHYGLHVHEQPKNRISLIKQAYVDVLQSHPLRRTRFGQY